MIETATHRPTATRPPILCVDDEPRVLEGLRLQLGRQFAVSTSLGGMDALGLIASAPAPFEVVISDMRMPGMDGATFLGKVRETSPTSTRILLTGQSELDVAIAAINEGQIFRFLTKPCPPELLLKAVQDGKRQFDLVTAERVLLNETLIGSIRAMLEFLSMTQPASFGRASRIKKITTEIAVAAKVENVWEIQVAAMLSQLGCITLAPQLVERLHAGKALGPEEEAQVERLPLIALRLAEHIPRLERVREILRFANTRFDGWNSPDTAISGNRIPVGARILRIATDCDTLQLRGMDPAAVVEALRHRGGCYDPHLVDLLATVVAQRPVVPRWAMMPLRRVREGMVFAEDVRNAKGRLLIARGHEVTSGMLRAIENLDGTQAAIEVRMVVPEEMDE